MCCVQKYITWAHCKIRLLFTSNIEYGFISKHILWCTYDVSQNNWIDAFYNIIFTYERTKYNHKTIEWCDSTSAYTYFFIVLSQFELSHSLIYIQN